MTDEKLTAEQAKLVKGWMSLAHGTAMNLWKRNPSAMPLDDMISIAYQGLVQAALRFEPDRPGNDANYDPYIGFGTYAKRRIIGALLDWQRSQDHVPRRQRQTYKQLQEHGHGAGRSPEELADLTGLPAVKIRAITYAVESSAVSLDDTWDDAEQPGSTEGSVLVSSIQAAVADTVRDFPPIQRSVFVLRYYSGRDFPDIATELGISTMTARSLHSDALLVLHGLLREAAS